MLERRPGWWIAAIYATALVVVALAVGPAIWLVLGAFQPAGGDVGDPVSSLVLGVEGDGADRQRATLENFGAAWGGGDLARPLINSVIVTAARTTLGVLLAALAAYPLARMSFAGRRILFLVILATTMIPEQVIVVPMFRIVVSMGLYDTLIAAILPFSVSAFGIYLCRQAFMSIPFDLEEAARIDGANSMQIWWHVMLPLAGPTLATLAVFSVIAAWSDLLWPLVVLQSEHNHTLPVAINRLLGVFATNIRIAYAASVLALIPIIVFFLIAQRFLKAGIFAGAVKG